MSNRIIIEVRGQKKLEKLIGSAVTRAPKELNGLLAEAALRVHEEAVLSIQNPPKSGRIYKRRGVTHQASAPGQAPATDRGALVSSISVLDSRFLKYVVGSSEKESPHGFFLEFGTSKMARRPWLIPSTMKVNKWLSKALKGLRAHG